MRHTWVSDTNRGTGYTIRGAGHALRRHLLPLRTMALPKQIIGQPGAAGRYGISTAASRRNAPALVRDDQAQIR